MDEDAKQILYDQKGVNPSLKKILAANQMDAQGLAKSLSTLDGRKVSQRQGALLPGKIGLYSKKISLQ